MARIIIAVVYIAAILVIGILAGRNVKTSEEFATANRGIPFWTNVFSMSSAWIGAGSTLGCASMCYAYGVSGFYLAIGVGIGAMLSSLLFARKIRDENVSTIPELIRKHLGNKCADAIALLSIFSVFSVVASQIRSLGTILNMFVPQLSLLTAMIIMTAVMLVYTVIGGMVAATKTDKVNIILMVFAVVMVFAAGRADPGKWYGRCDCCLAGKPSRDAQSRRYGWLGHDDFLCALLWNQQHDQQRELPAYMRCQERQ